MAVHGAYYRMDIYFGIQKYTTWSKAVELESFRILLKGMKNASCMYDMYIDNSIVSPYHKRGCLQP